MFNIELKVTKVSPDTEIYSTCFQLELYLSVFQLD